MFGMKAARRRRIAGIGRAPPARAGTYVYYIYTRSRRGGGAARAAAGLRTPAAGLLGCWAGAGMRRFILLTMTVMMVAAAFSHRATARQSLSLDGAWNFTLIGAQGNQSGSIQVPGSWEAQGFGTETVQMRHQVLTGDNAHGGRGVVGLYTKKVNRADISCPARHTAFLMVDQGIHRHAFFKADGKLLGEHRGYLTPFEAELECWSAGCTIEITLDGGRPCAPWTTPGGPTNCTENCGGCSDALIGAADDDTDGTGLGGWVGLNGHVSIECRPPIFIDGGVGNIIPPRVHHPHVTTASAGKPLTVSVDLEISGGAAIAAVQIFDNSPSGTSVKVAASAPSTTPRTGNITLLVVIPAVKLWSPENRNLYTAVVTIGPHAAPLDSATTRFGVRTIVVDGYQLLLNGKRVFLAGYGDDAIYPLSVAPPREKDIYSAKVEFAHKHGFNFVRHHSHVLPPEYFEAADDWGIMVSPELPCAYGNYFTDANRTGQELYVKSWSSYIASLRNHPSILTWTLLNEMYMGANFTRGGETFGAELFYRIKQDLDPDRLMMDQDGACGSQDVRDSLSFCSSHMHVLSMGCVGYDIQRNCLGSDAPTSWVPNKYHDRCNRQNGSCEFVPTPLIPIISHETGNYNTYPRITSLIEQFNRSGTTIRPYWLTGALNKLNASGLLSEVDAWATASERLYVTCWKLDVEDHRHNPQISGYEWWLLQDYWTGNNGITDTFLRPKPAVQNAIQQFNARSILIQDGLLLSYTSGDPIAIDVSLSNFGPSDLPRDTKLQWSVLLNGKKIQGTEVGVQSVAQGTLGVVASIALTLPDIGTSDSVSFGEVDGPKTLTLTANLTGNAFATQVPGNSWNSTLFPRWKQVASPTSGKARKPIKVTSADLLPPSRCGFSDCQLSSVYPAPTAAPAVYLTKTVTDALIESVRNGSVLVLLENTTTGAFKTSMTPFKQAWWLGNSVDCNAGTLVYPCAAAILGGMAPEHYADQTWWRLVNGAQTFLLDEMPTFPGSWSAAQKGVYGEQDGCRGPFGQSFCPPDFPFPTHAPAPLKDNICYKTRAEAFAGEGPCGSWCTLDARVGFGCGGGSAHVCAKLNATRCPAEFPFQSHANMQICYKTQAEAAAGTGPCNSWCTKEGQVGPGCGSVCKETHWSTCTPMLNISMCEDSCDANPACSALNYNRSVGCCLQDCSSASLGPPKSTNTSSCCGYYRTTGGPVPTPTVMMRAIDVVGLSRNKALLWSAPVGAGHIVATGLNLLNQMNTSAALYPEQAWVLDRLLRYAVSLL
eukprot:SAG31_NODE_1206_length_9388_cov_7.855420_2_plen_1278_part_00